MNRESTNAFTVPLEKMGFKIIPQSLFKNRACCFTVGKKEKQGSEEFSGGTWIKEEGNGTWSIMIYIHYK